MASAKETNKPRLYLGVDIGGTKIQASLVEESGTILRRERIDTPRDCRPLDVLAALEQAIDEVVRAGGIEHGDLDAMGIAVPGVVDPDTGKVVVTPNAQLSGVDMRAHLEKRYKLPVAVGNDCNLGALGESWLGSARRAKSAVAILVGTGIGSGIVLDGRLWTGARESAAEIGHIVMQIGGPRCGCGNDGCFEALASRSAIERGIREAIAQGRKSVVSELLDDASQLIRSGTLRKALEQNDEVVTEVMRQASVVLGHACLTVRHLLDPEVIVLGGGVVEACGDFVLPIVERILAADRLPGAREGGHIRLSALDDDAVVLGAVAIARIHVDRDPFQEQYAVKPAYREITQAEFGKVTVGDETYTRDVIVRVDGKVRKRKKALAKQLYGSSHTIGPRELRRVCRGGAEVVFIGTGHSGQIQLTDDARQFLSRRLVECEALRTPDAVDAYNRCPKRKAALIHVTC